MLVLNRRQRALLAEKSLDLANLALGALVFGQFLGERAFSRWLGGFGIACWILFVAASVFLAGGED